MPPQLQVLTWTHWTSLHPHCRKLSRQTTNTQHFSPADVSSPCRDLPSLSWLSSAAFTKLHLNPPSILTEVLTHVLLTLRRLLKVSEQHCAPLTLTQIHVVNHQLVQSFSLYGAETWKSVSCRAATNVSSWFNFSLSKFYSLQMSHFVPTVQK